jgi:XTP/dITP diphosphohydrolase
MKELLFGTGNANKVSEIQGMVPDTIRIVSMRDKRLETELPETRDTIQGNAVQKVEALFEMCPMNGFSEDTGLEVFALNGSPGVHTARYAGEEKDPQKNMELLLDRLEGVSDRSAQFRTVIALIWQEELHTFEGIVKGTISKEIRGSGGFGYDPLFIPKGYQKTFAELPITIKKDISHRSRAFQKMLAFLNS